MSTGTPTTPAGITVDTANETVTLEFVDDRGNVTNPPPGATVTFNSTNTGVADIQPDPGNPFKATIVPGSVGTVNISATVTGASDPRGNPLPNPDPVMLQVNAGAPVGERLTVASSSPSDPTPAPAPPTPPAPTPPAAAEPTQPVYTYSGTGTPDATVWPESGFQTTEEPPRLLYYYSGDQPNSGQGAQPTGNGADGGAWVAYTGQVSAVPQPGT